VWGGEGEGRPFFVIFGIYVGGMSCFLLDTVFEFANEAGGEIVVLCNVEYGLPFFVLSVLAKREIEHPLDVIPVCCQLVFTRVIGSVVDGCVGSCGLTENVNF
jgi:hypothetical protein